MPHTVADTEENKNLVKNTFQRIRYSHESTVDISSSCRTTKNFWKKLKYDSWACMQ